MAGKGPPPRRTPLLAALAAGLLAFALGAVLALAFLPEWRTGGLPDPRPFRERFQEIAHEAGLRPVQKEPALRLDSDDFFLSAVYRVLGEKAAAWLTGTRSGVLVSMTQEMRHPGEEAEGSSGSGSLWTAGPSRSAGRRPTSPPSAPGMGTGTRPWRRPSSSRSWPRASRSDRSGKAAT